MRAGAALAAFAAAIGGVAAQRIDLNTTLVPGDMGWVHAVISGVPKDDTGAWVGVYPSGADLSVIPEQAFPATPPWTATAPLEYIYAWQLNGGWANGSVTWDIQLPQLFTNVTVHLFTGDIYTPQLLASSAPIAFAQPAAPLRGHIARTPDPTQMSVVWQSAIADPTARVRWGSAPGVYTSEAPVVSVRTYSQADMCGAPANSSGWAEPGFFHYALITGLQPSVPVGPRVFYVYGGDASGWSAELSFVTPPPVGPNVPVNALVIADMGTFPADGATAHWPEWEAPVTMERMRDVLASDDSVSLVLHAGDIAYSTGYLLKQEQYLSRLAGVMDAAPYMTGLGNHERDFPDTGVNPLYALSVDSGGECGVPTQMRYPSPGWNGSAPDPGWWSLQHGSAHIIMLNSELPIGPGTPQYAWLEGALAAVDRSLTPWLILAWHRPMYYIKDAVYADTNFQAVEPLLLQAQVDVLYTGHVHNLFVTKPVFNGTAVSPPAPGAYDAPVHVCVGNAGMWQDLIWVPLPEWGAFASSAYGYSTLSIANATHLTMSFYQDETNDLLYSTTIVRTFPRA